MVHPSSFNTYPFWDDNILIYRSKNENIVIYPADVVIVEGILAFYFPAIRDLFHMKLFVDTDSDTRLARRGNIILYYIYYIKVYILFIFKLIYCVFCSS